MKDVYVKTPQMGDPNSLDHKLAEVSQNIEKLRLETQKFEVGKSCCGKALLGEKKKKEKKRNRSRCGVTGRMGL